MSRVSKFIKVDQNILFEYVYSDQNLIGEDYKVLINNTNDTLSYIASDSSGTKNTKDNQLVLVDAIDNKYGLVDTDTYNFIQLQDYAGGIPVRHDIMRIHFPINYTFGEYLGFNIKVYVLNYDNDKMIELSNYFFDISDTTKFNQMGFTSPELLFQEQLWGKNIEISIPSPYALSLQRENNNAKEDSINANISNLKGLSTSSPIIIDFKYITKKDVINNVTTYLTRDTVTLSYPLVPEFDNLAVKIQESTQGDYFEIFGIYNDTISEFNKFITDSVLLGKRYYVEYDITMYEENIRGKRQTFIITDDFNEPVEFRPIIKFSTTTAIIDVEMKIIDRVDNSQITRRASYGLKGTEVNKYSLSLTKINVDNVSKPKIYNLKNVVELGKIANLNGLIANNSTNFEQVKVPYPVMVSNNNIVVKSNNVRNGENTFYGLGKLQIFIYPFDNVINFLIAKDFSGANTQLEFMDLSGTNIELVFKNENLNVRVPIYTELDTIDLANGFVSFKIMESQISDIRKIAKSGINAFYLTTNFNNDTTILYPGTFIMFDSEDNISTLNDNVEVTPIDTTPSFIEGNNTNEQAIITRRQIRKDNNN